MAKRLRTWLARKARVSFLLGQVWPRRARITYLDFTFWIALASGPGLAILFSKLPGGDLAIRDLAGAGLSYASIAFGACVTGVVLVLTIPNPKHAERWATRTSGSSQFSHYSDLIFVLTWSAVA